MALAGRVIPDHKLTANGVALTSGAIARMCGVAMRTAAKWCDSGKLPSHRVPLSKDRRVYAHDLRAFLESQNHPIPVRLTALLGLNREVILYRCLPAVCDRLAAQAGGVTVRRVEDEWELGSLFARPHVSGVLVCGDGAATSEIARVFARVGRGWVKVHALGPDQEPAAGADLAFVGDAPALTEGLTLALAGAA